MRENIYTADLADIRDVKVGKALPKSERAAEYMRQPDNDPNSYIFEGYSVRETFDPDGPPLADCIVRVFA